MPSPRNQANVTFPAPWLLTYGASWATRNWVIFFAVLAWALALNSVAAIDPSKGIAYTVGYTAQALSFPFVIGPIISLRKATRPQRDGGCILGWRFRAEMLAAANLAAADQHRAAATARPPYLTGPR